MKNKFQLDFAKMVKVAAVQRGQASRVAATARDFELLMERGIKILAKQKHLKVIFGGAGNGGEISLTLVNDKEIKSINNDFRGIDKATDVVSLSYIEEMIKANASGRGQVAVGQSKEAFMPAHSFKNGLASLGLIGEIFISVDTAARQAKEHKMTLKQELQFLFTHGLLHVFGYDHEQEDERKIMFDLQDEILKTKMWRPLLD